VVGHGNLSRVQLWHGRQITLTVNKVSYSQRRRDATYLALNRYTNRKVRPLASMRVKMGKYVFIVALMVGLSSSAFARDDGRYVNDPLKY
jgi:hypothetical protein